MAASWLYDNAQVVHVQRPLSEWGIWGPPDEEEAGPIQPTAEAEPAPAGATARQ